MNGMRFPIGRGQRGSDDIRQPLRRKLPATVENANRLRRELRTWLDVDVEIDIAEDLVLAVYEALANVVEHAYRERQGPMTMTVRRNAESVVVSVTDRGTWRDGPSGQFRGRGIPLMHKLADETNLDHSSAGTSVRLRVTAAVRSARRDGSSALKC